MATWYVSNAAQNTSAGWVNGSDSNAGTSRATAFATIAKGCSSAASGDTVIVNPTSVAYAENSSSTGYLDIGNVALLTGDTTLYASVGGATIQAASATSRVINVATNTSILQTIQCCTIDMQSGASRQGISPHQSSIGLVLSQVKFINANAQNLIGNFSSGSGAVTLDRVTVDSTCSMGSASLFGFMSSNSVSKVIVSGGSYASSHSGSNACLYGNGATLTTLSITADSSGNPVTFSGTCGYHIRLHNCTITTLTISGTTYSSMPSQTVNVLIDGGTANSYPITSGAVSNNTFPVAGGLGVQLTGVTCSSFLISNNTCGSNYGLCGVQCSEYTQNVSVLNNTVTCPATFSGGGNYNAISGWGSGFIVQGNTITANGTTTATLPSHLIDIVADGTPTDSSNTAASTGTQALGSASNNVLVSMSAVTVSFGSTGRFPQLAAFQCYLAKQGSPTSTIGCAVYTDNSGSPGTLLGTSTTTVAASSLSTSAAQYLFYFDVATPINLAANTRYHYVLTTTTTDASNYVTVSTNSTVTNGFMNTGTSAPVWTQATGTALLYTVSTCCWGVTPGPQVIGNSLNYSNVLNETGSPENEGINVSSSTGVVIARNLIICGGYGIVIKNNYGATNANICYGNLIYVPINSYGGIYPKATRGTSVYNNTVILGGTCAGRAVLVDSDSLSVSNRVASVNTQVKNNILVANGSTSAIYGLGNSTAQIGTMIDYNVVYFTGSNLIENQTYNTGSWSTWQALGYDTHSVNANPLLTSITPAVATDFYPLSTSPAIGAGTDLRTYAPYGYDYNPYLPKSTDGGYSWFTGELLCEVNSATNVYALVWNLAGQVWNTATVAFEAYRSTNYANYAIGMAQAGASSTWRGNFPASVASAGMYDVQFRSQAGASAAESDTVIVNGRHKVPWNGASAVQAYKANVAPSPLVVSA